MVENTALNKISGKLDAFIFQYNLEREADKIYQKNFVEYLQKDVSRALNGQTEMRNQITENLKKINEIEIREARCPISGLTVDVSKLLEETEESRAIHKYSRLRKGLQLLNTVGNIAAIVLFAGGILALILDWKNIF